MRSRCILRVAAVAFASLQVACTHPRVQPPSLGPLDSFAQLAGLPSLAAVHVSQNEEEIRILLTRSWRRPHYMLRIRSNPNAAAAWLYYFTEPPFSSVDVAALPNAGALRARLDSLAVRDLVAPDVQDGECVRQNGGARTCSGFSDTNEIAIAVLRPMGLRFHRYTAVGLRDAPAAQRAAAIANTLQSLAKSTWPELPHNGPNAHR